MMDTNSPSKTFLGVRFVLLGFEAIHKQKIRSKLVSGGGVDVGKYSQNCTHVIVDKLVFDDPACVAARSDGKMVVTAIWVDHSYDVGMPLDAASIMYRPRKDLDGIPGAKDLIMCLTGYQRQDRDDIMTMVGLMGAQFSKPLVANKVTHLICYKFEGEKYELAKRMKKIKLVNHRWLEDCLREWEILPEANYEKSGYELEMMEAEAKDSEEEDEGTAVKQYGGKSISRSPNNVKTGMTKAHELPLTFGKGSKFPDASTSEIVPDAVNAKEVLRTPVKDERSVSAKLNDIDVSGALGCQDVGAEKVATFSKLPDSSVRTPDSKTVGNDLASTSKTVEMSPPSEMKSPLSYSRKTPRRSTLSMYSGDRTSNLSRSPRAQLDEFMINDCSNAFSSKVEQFRDANTTPCAKSPLKGSKLFGEELNSILPQKRKMDSSSATPVSSAQKTNHDTNPSNSGNVSTDNTSLFYNGLSVGRTGNLAENSRAPISATKSPSDLHLVQTMTGQIDNIDGKLQETTFERSEMLTSDGKAGTSDFLASISADIVHDKGEAVDQQQDVDISYYSSKRTEGEISHNPLQLDLPKEVSGNVKTKPLRQKTVAKKTLGSRPKLCKSANRKGSIYVNEAATQNEVAICTSGGKERADLEKSSDADKHVVSSPTLIVDAVKDVVDNKAESIDDETEAPDDKYDHEFGKTFIEVDTIMKEQSDEVHVKTSDLNDTMPQDIAALEKTTNNVETEKADCGKNLELGESVCKVDASTEKTKKKKRPRGNTKIKSAPAVKEDGKSMNETMIEKEKGVSRPTAKAKESIVLADLNDTMPPAITALEKVTNQAESENADVVKNLEMERSTSTVDNVTEKNKSKKRLPGNKTKTKSAPATKEIDEIKEDGQNMEETEMEKERKVPQLAGKTKKSTVKRSEKSMTVEKENKPVENAEDTSQVKDSVGKSDDKSNRTPIKTEKSNPNSVQTGQILSRMKSEPVWFILSGHRFQRKEFQQVIRRLKGKVCRDSHQWSYQATHFIAPDPIRRTEKFFAAAASGRWILKMDYLTACNQAGKFLAEEPYEWHKTGLSEDGAINLEAPRKWRLLRERTGHGAFYGVRIIIYGECIAPPLDTLKRVVKAGDGTILATSPPYNRFLNSGVDFAIVSPGMPRVDMWVQEFLRHEIPCVVADYLVEYVCKPGYSLEKHVLYNTNAWAKKSFANLQSRAENIMEDLTTSSDCGSDGTTCQVCGSRDRGEVMLICGNESGSVGCGAARHIDCCDPPLESVPEEDWFCRNCCRKGDSSNLSDKSKNRKSSSKKKRRS